MMAYGLNSPVFLILRTHKYAFSPSSRLKYAKNAVSGFQSTKHRVTLFRNVVPPDVIMLIDRNGKVGDALAKVAIIP